MIDDDRCSKCGVLVGRARRTNEELVALFKAKKFTSKIESWDYKADPPTVTVYCPPCFAARPR